MKSFIMFALTGIISGFVNGFLGTGGGIIIVAALTLISKKHSDPKKIFATTNFVILILSLISLYAYFKKGALDSTFEDTLYVYIIPALFGGFLGALCLERINPSLLKKAFCLLISYCGIRMLLQ